MQLVHNTSALPGPSLSPAMGLQGGQEDYDINKEKDGLVFVANAHLHDTWQRHGQSVALDAEEFDTALLSEGGVPPSLTAQSPDGESHSFGQAKVAVARAALLSAAVQMETVAPPAVPECSSGGNTVSGKRSVQVQVEAAALPVALKCSSEGNTTLGKRSTRSEDEEDPESAADAQPYEMHGSSCRAILAEYCYELGYAQPKVTSQLHVGEAGLSGRCLYHVSMSVGQEYFSLQRSYDSIQIATERLSEQALNSFGIRPKTL